MKLHLKKLCFVVLCVFLCSIYLGMFAAVLASETTVSLNISSFTKEEAANVIASYSNLVGSHPWMGIYKKNVTPNSNGGHSLGWKDIPAGSGTFDFSGLSDDSGWNSAGPGEYKLCLFADYNTTSEGLYPVVAQVDFTVIVEPPSNAPVSVVYNRESTAKRGFAQGTIVITPPANRKNMTGYAAYWGDDNGPFSGYAPIKIHGITDSGKSTRTYTTVQNMIIPPGTTKLYVYSASGTGIPYGPTDIVKSELAATADVDENAALEEETPLYSFQVTSDWHMFAAPEDNIKAKRLDAMFKDIKNTDPDSIAIIAAGDIADNSAEDKSMPGITPEKANAEYDMVRKVVEKNKENLPPILYAIGNHDMRGGDGYTAQLNRFLEKTGTQSGGKPYYYKEIGKAKFIILGGEHTGDNEYLNAELSTKQIEWFENTLKEHAKTSEPIFVIIHQPLRDTTSGTTRGFRWYGVNQNAVVRKILKKYPQVVWFSGHTHWELESNDPIYTGYGSDFSAFNDGGVGKLYTDEDKDKEGSQGLFVEVYKDKLLVKGRDFENKLWVTSAQFMLDTTLPASVRTQEWTANNASMLSHEDNINALYQELSAMGEDKHSFTDIFSRLEEAKNYLKGVDPSLKAFRKDLDTLKQQTADNEVEKNFLDTLKATYETLNSDQSALFPDALEIISAAQAQYESAEAAKKRTVNVVRVIDSSGTQYACAISGSNISVTVPYGTKTQDMRLAVTANKSDATIFINDTQFTSSSQYDLSSPVQIRVLSPFGAEYGAVYTLTVKVGKNPFVAVSGITLNKTKGSVYVGQTVTLKASVKPADATQPTVAWLTSNSKIAKVSNGKVTAVGIGKVTITAVAGGKKAAFKLTVKKPGSPTKVKAKASERKITVSFKKGVGAVGTCIVIYNSKGKIVAKKYKTSGSSYIKKSLKEGRYTVEVYSYRKAGSRLFISKKITRKVKVK